MHLWAQGRVLQCLPHGECSVKVHEADSGDLLNTAGVYEKNICTARARQVPQILDP